MTVESITETTQYLTFRLADELFALDICKVREVLDFTSIIPLSHYSNIPPLQYSSCRSSG